MRKRYVFCILLILSAAVMFGCAAERQMTKAETDQLDAIAAKIARVEGMDARECAPKELARAMAILDHARHEVREGRYLKPSTIQGFIDEANNAADELLAKTTPCWEEMQARLQQAAPAEEAAPVVPAPVAPVQDSDGDGVPDSLDKCPGTPVGVTVDEAGCPRDSDGDGVPDYRDKCPDTLPGLLVDEDGCPPEK